MSKVLDLNTTVKKIGCIYEEFLLENWGKVKLSEMQDLIIKELREANVRLREDFGYKTRYYQPKKMRGRPAPSNATIERAAQMADMKLNERMTLEEIGAHYGMTRERVRQILNKFSKEQYQAYRADVSEAAQRKREALKDEIEQRKIERQKYWDQCHDIAKQDFANGLTWDQVLEKNGWTRTIQHQLLDKYVDLIRFPRVRIAAKMTDEIWNERYEIAKRVLSDGGSSEEIASKLHISISCITAIYKKFPDLKQLVKDQRDKKKQKRKCPTFKIYDKVWEQRYTIAKEMLDQGKSWDEVKKALNLKGYSSIILLQNHYPDLKKKPGHRKIGKGNHALSPDVWQFRYDTARQILFYDKGTWNDVARKLDLKISSMNRLKVKFPDLKNARTNR